MITTIMRAIEQSLNDPEQQQQQQDIRLAAELAGRLPCYGETQSSSSGSGGGGMQNEVVGDIIYSDYHPAA